MAGIWEQAQKSIWDEAAASLQAGEAPRDLAQEARDKELYRQNFPEMAAQDAATSPKSRAVQEVRAEHVAAPSAGKLMSAPTSGYYDESKRPTTPPVDWAEVGRDQVRNLPKYGAAAGTALATVLAPEVTLPAMVAAGTLGGMAGYHGARAVRSPVEEMLQMKPSDQGSARELVNSFNTAAENTLMSNPTALANAAEMVQGVPRAVGNAISNAAKKMRIPENFVSRYIQRPPSSRDVATVLEEGIPVSRNKAVQFGGELRNKTYGPANEALAAGEEAGNIVDIEQALNDARNVVNYYADMRPGSPQLAAAQRELRILERYKRQMTPTEAEGKKQFYNQAISDWESSQAKDLAKKPAIAVQKAFKRGLVRDIAPQTADAEAYTAANEEYGPVARLFKKRGEFSPLEKADMTASAQNPLRRVYQTAKEYGVVKPIAAMRRLGSETPAVTDFANVGAPRDISEMMRLTGTRYAPPNTWSGPEIPSGATAGGPETFQGPTQRVWQGPPNPPLPTNDYLAEEMLAQQGQPNIPVAESIPGYLTEGVVPQRGFTYPEGHGQVRPGITSEGLGEGIYRPPTLMPEEAGYEGTLMEGSVPPRELEIQKLLRKGRKK